MQVYDDILDDSNIMDGLYVGIRDNLYTDGWLARIPVDTADGSVEKNAFVFTRNNNNVQKNSFKITPEKFSDYAITISNVDNNIYLDSRNEQKNFKVTVSYKSWNKTKYVELMEAPKYDGLNKTLTYNFVLDKNIEYTIDVVHSNAQPDFSVAISQNNWVYAPNGGIRMNVYDPRNNTYATESYFTSDTIIKLIVDRAKNADGSIINIDEQDDDQRKSFIERCGAEYVEESFELGYQNANNILDAVGSITTVTGIILMAIPESDLLGGLLTFVDCALFPISVKGTNQSNLEKALIDGKYNLCIRSGYKWVDKSPVSIGHQVISNECKSWNECRYINKYPDISRYRRCEVVSFSSESEVLKKYDNSWILE